MEKKDAQLGQLIKTYSGLCIVLGVDADCIDKIRTALTYDLNNPLIKRDMASMIEEYRKTVQVSCYVVCPRLDIKSDYIDKVPKGYVFDGMHTSRNLSYLSVSTLDTWVKKDVNKYRKASFTENGRPNLEWETLL